ncbi:hypothetical protein O3M35_007742 [Rhynocoris fuscipes]|uniref:Uncharacterized protein n=1 Tax=Rhynocoris fuscipes TaxID=488301 RepID=A0AAW1DAM0_9HEMI
MENSCRLINHKNNMIREKLELITAHDISGKIRNRRGLVNALGSVIKSISDIENSLTFCKLKSFHPSIMSARELYEELKTGTGPSQRRTNPPDHRATTTEQEPTLRALYGKGDTSLECGVTTLVSGKGLTTLHHDRRKSGILCHAHVTTGGKVPPGNTMGMSSGIPSHTSPSGDVH